ncbi:MAG: hypothetical protein QM667_13585 [Asticcacaulis sp.]
MLNLRLPFSSSKKCNHVWERLADEPVFDAYQPSLEIGSRRVQRCKKCAAIVKGNPR